ncbi:MAG: ATP-dependent DNA ligase [Granulosicoccus sp.]|nr:ATP-dependent DNA ligase [Granulosicoccus sp.]
MQAFSQLYQTLDQTTSVNAKVAAMVSYFQLACARDAAWAVYFLSGRRLKRLVPVGILRDCLRQTSELPEWLIDETYTNVGDLAETIALLVAEPGKADDELSLADWVENHLLSLRGLPAEQQQVLIRQWWERLNYEQCYIINKLMTGALRVGVSELLLARAVAHTADLPRALIVHRLMGEWTPDQAFWHRLVDEDDGEAVNSRPYPFYLASPLQSQPIDLGPVEHWIAEWKWDGIRAQLIRRGGESYLWSRGEELIGARFPEIVDATRQLPDGTVLDGEILPWNSQGIMPFAQLQRRIGRKNVGKKLLTEVPCLFLAYDLMEHEGEDIRQQPLGSRRRSLEEIINVLGQDRLRLSTDLRTTSWEQLAAERQTSRERKVEGLMLKHRDSSYATGRKRGFWWKWKVEPYTVDAVMIYAQAGHGRRASLFTDYTFGVWQDDVLVPIAKAYSGLDNSEINELDRWIRRNTIERFGPVRSVASEQVFELAFEGINRSSRHKSGIAVRFPRITRWRKDKAARDADSLETIMRLIDDPA